MRPLLLLLWLALLAPAVAHPGHQSFWLLRHQGNQLELEWTVPRAEGSQIDANGNGALEVEELTARLPDLLEIQADGQPPASIEVTEPASDVGDLAWKVKARLTWDKPVGGLRLAYSLFAPDAATPGLMGVVYSEGEKPQTFILTPEAPATTLVVGHVDANFSGFFLLGLEHIVTGYDHVLFLLCLLLPGGTLLDLAKLVTAFTLAHSVTLAMAVLGVVTLPSKPVELAIALSIVVAAAMAFRERKQDLRWQVAAGFGLLHGFGFSGILSEMGLHGPTAAMPLLGFNLGVEAGQLAIVMVAFPILVWVSKQKWAMTFRRQAAALIGLVGLYWLCERAVS